MKLETRNIRVVIEGIAPLLMNRFPADSPETAARATRKTGTKDYRAKAEEAAYRNVEGKLYQPADHIIGALVKAAVNFQIPGKGKKTYKDLFRSSVFVHPDEIEHQIQDYEIDARPVVIQKSRVMRYRPKLTKWRLEFTLEIQDPDIADSVVKDIMEYAGRRVGIGDYRPRFGRFMVTEFTPAEDGY